MTWFCSKPCFYNHRIGEFLALRMKPKLKNGRCNYNCRTQCVIKLDHRNAKIKPTEIRRRRGRKAAGSIEGLIVCRQRWGSRDVV